MCYVLSCTNRAQTTNGHERTDYQNTSVSGSGTLQEKIRSFSKGLLPQKLSVRTARPTFR